MSRVTEVTAEIRALADALLRERGGTLGVAATFLPTGETVAVNADETFPTASVIKVAVVAELFTQAAEGRLDPAMPITVAAEDHVAGSGVLALLSPGLTLPLADLAMLTICVSDNTASNRCLRAVGGPEAVNARMREAWGMTGTIVHRPIKFGLEPGDPPHTATGTPRDMARLLGLLAKGEARDRATSDAVLRLMAEVRDEGLLPRYLHVNPYAADLRVARPPFVVQHKTGKVEGVRNDAAVVRRGDEVLVACAYTKGVRDGRWTPANAGEEAVAAVGRALASAFFD